MAAERLELSVEFDDEILRVVKECESANKDNVRDAIECAMAAIKALPCYENEAGNLFRTAVATLVYRERGRVNHAQKNHRGEYHTTTKVRTGDSVSSEIINRGYVDMRIGGHTLGNLLLKELPGIRDSEAKIAKGHFFNVELLDRIIGKTARKSQELKVSEALSDNVINKIGEEVFREFWSEPELAEAGH